MEINTEINIATTVASKDYELLDSGDGEKLERFGTMILSRPDPQALWPKRLSAGASIGVTDKIFTAPSEKLTEDYVTGRFG